MKKLKHIINWMLWSLLTLYVGAVALMQLPSAQQFIGRQIASVIADRLGTEMAVDRVEMGFLNRLILDDVMVFDQSRKEMLSVGRLSVKLDVLPLLEGRISISSAQLFGMHAHLYKTDSLAAPNYQFVIDSLASNDTTSNSSVNLRINSLIIRHSSVSYDEHHVSASPDKFNPKHLNISDISGHVVLKALQEDSLNVNIKRLAFKEQSGLQVNRLSLWIEANNHQAIVRNFHLQLPHSDVTLDNGEATYVIDRLKETLRYHVFIKIPELTPADLACFLPPLQAFNQQLAIEGQFRGTGSETVCHRFLVSSSDHSLELQASGRAINLNKQPEWLLQTLDISVSHHFVMQCQQAFEAVPAELANLGDIRLEGNARRNAQGNMKTHTNIQTDIGNATLQLTVDDDRQFSGTLATDSFHIGKLLNHADLGRLATRININGHDDDVEAEGEVNHLEYKGYAYQDIKLDASYKKGDIAGHININDPNLQTDLEGEFKKRQRSVVSLTGYFHHLKPSALHLTDHWGEAHFSGAIDANFTATSLNDAEGAIDLDDFEMRGVDSLHNDYHLDNLHIKSGFDQGIHYVKVNGDMGEADIHGHFDWQTLSKSFTHYIASKLPTLPGLPAHTQQSDNNFEMHLLLTDTDWMQKLMGIPLSLERPLELYAVMDDTASVLDINGRLPMFTYDGSRYQDATLNITTEDNSMRYQANLTKVMDDEGLMDMALNGKAADNNLSLSFLWDFNNLHEPQKSINGTVNTITQLYTNESGKAEAHIRVLPSQVIIREKAWSLEPCDILYSADRLLVDHFSLNHGRQHLTIDGIASKSPSDSITVDLQEIEVAYILDLVNFHAVEFEGLATGNAYISRPFSEFEASADLTVSQFRFETGNMGNLLAHAEWNPLEEQIDIDAVADDGPLSQTVIKGYVSPVRSDIYLDIRAQGSNIEFCKSFTESFLHDVGGKAYGGVVLSGPLKELNLTGSLVVDGQATVTALNTTYQLEKDTVLFVPNDVLFRHCAIKDRDGHLGFVTGGIHHDCLSDITFDVDIEAENLLAYDFPDFNEEIICGTVYATGTADMHGRPGEVTINCYVTPEARSVFAYNATNPDAISRQEFINWGDPSRKEKRLRVGDSPQPSTDIYINFNINAIPQGTLRVLMDANTNDYITLNGNGSIKATFYNKGPFNMFGTYTVEKGTYGITIQNIIKKNFIFQNGGTIVFGGDPFYANLNLQAQYTVNGVSLSDLNLGNSFSNNTVRVNCLMNIQGTPSAPHVEFDFELPTVNAEENQMIRSVITSEQEMNQQVLYLLGIGRFYTQGSNNAESQQYGQTQLAMQSFLSGTVSSQINEVLAQVIKSNDWNFGANISTGNEGWHNAEYEGLFSGRMLNNRLLINGQFGYRDNATQANPSFIGDFDIQYLLKANGNIAVKVYNQTNDRYFTRSSLNTQGVGLIMKKDFNGLSDLFHFLRKSK